MSDIPYPLTVVRCRYSGVYEGGAFAAFNKNPDEILWRGAFDDDCACAAWWGNARERGEVIGVGDSPQEAVDNLAAILTAKAGAR